MTDPRISDDTRPLRPPLAEMRPPRQHGWVLWAVVAAMVLLPILEVSILIRTGQLIGFGPTVLLLIASSALGAWLMKREGMAAWRQLMGAFSAGRMPTGELADAGLVLVGGTLLLLPGLITDVVGLGFLLPATRPLARRALAYALTRKGDALELRRPASAAMPGDPDVVPGTVTESYAEPTPTRPRGATVSGDVQDASGHVVRELDR